MFSVFSNHWIYFWIALFLLFQNILRAFPAPDASVSKGFGSVSPGYKFFYAITQGLKGDLAAIGVDATKLTKGLVKNGDA